LQQNDVKLRLSFESFCSLRDTEQKVTKTGKKKQKTSDVAIKKKKKLLTKKHKPNEEEDNHMDSDGDDNSEDDGDDVPIIDLARGEGNIASSSDDSDDDDDDEDNQDEGASSSKLKRQGDIQIELDGDSNTDESDYNEQVMFTILSFFIISIDKAHYD